MEYLNKANNLAKKTDTLNDLVINIQRYLNNHFSGKKNRYRARSILESRFVPSKIAFSIGMQSCGSLTNIAVDMLRHLGYTVKKIHGSIPQSTDHSWIKVMSPKNNEWEAYDITQKDCKISGNHKEIAECNDWSEIAEQLIKAHLGYKQRKRF